MQMELARKRFTADEYQRMAQVGILMEGDRVELIDGQVVPMMTIGPRHNAAVNRATRALFLAAKDAAIVQSQGSVRLDRYHEPQPDLVLLRPRSDFYASRLAGPDDILLVIEVAETSIDYDRQVKTRIYAELGVREYWLVDLNENVVTCHTDPEDDAYRSIEPFRRGESLAPQALPDRPVRVRDLLAE